MCPDASHVLQTVVCSVSGVTVPSLSTSCQSQVFFFGGGFNSKCFFFYQHNLICFISSPAFYTMSLTESIPGTLIRLRPNPTSQRCILITCSMTIHCCMQFILYLRGVVWVFIMVFVGAKIFLRYVQQLRTVPGLKLK